MDNNQRFSLGITYWPRRKAKASAGPYSLLEVDPGAIRDELTHIAEIGFTTIRLCLRWEEFQPGPARIGSAAMRALERTLDMAQTARLQVAAVLFDVASGGAIQLPSWATGITPGLEMALTTRFGAPLLASGAAQPPVLYDGRYHQTPVRDLYHNPEQLAAQRYLLAETIGYFASHPALWAWQIGLEPERARMPASADEVGEWLARLAEVARQHGAKQVLGATSTWALTRRETLRPAHLAELCDRVAIATHPYEPLRVAQPWQTDYVAFLHALTATLASKPVLVSSLALATHLEGKRGWVGDSAFGRSFYSYLADEEQQATFIENALTLLYRAGASGVWLAAYADVPQELWRVPPLDQAIRERTLGVVRADGNEKQAVASVRAFAARLRQGHLGAQGAPPALDTADEEYWRNPAGEMRRLYRDWGPA